MSALVSAVYGLHTDHISHFNTSQQYLLNWKHVFSLSQRIGTRVVNILTGCTRYGPRAFGNTLLSGFLCACSSHGLNKISSATPFMSPSPRWWTPARNLPLHFSCIPGSSSEGWLITEDPLTPTGLKLNQRNTLINNYWVTGLNCNVWSTISVTYGWAIYQIFMMHSRWWFCWRCRIKWHYE